MIDLKAHIRLSLGYFLLAAILGVVLRSFHSVEIPVNYRFIVHAHSHIALLGWVYMALTTMIYKLYLENEGLEKKYRFIFWFTQATLLGMLCTFPFQGYALFSIIFSTLFLFASYGFMWIFIRNAPNALKKTNSYKCIKWALWYMVISSIGPWALGAIMTTLGAGSIWYRIAIYFYLHFQYNGWMLMALIGLFFWIMEQHKIGMSNTIFKRFFWSINLGIVLSFFLSILWIKPQVTLYVISGFGALLQLVAFGILMVHFIKLKKKREDLFSSFQMRLLQIIAVVVSVKIGLQLLTAFPYFANLASIILDFTIGYLHWTFLGVISIPLFLFLDYFKLLRISKSALNIYLLGFLLTEVLIFYKGIVQWQRLSLFDAYFEVLAIASILIALALLFLLMANLMRKKSAD
ncbi:MAG: hypothetical protein COA50_08835 [Flavobacteriaceae bacterium]|nr:MAG: hypothetical protein COA50_08835 [Flavobacteriaceae bacterium]